MARVPRWKVKRELGRIRQQLSAIPEAIWEPIAQARHDRELIQRWPVSSGDHPALGKIAVILIFQPNGIAESLWRTLSHLSENEYAPFVVSNAPLLQKDVSRIASLSWRYMERPNFGYDFGGYKDAIRLIREWNIDPQRLLILNDSVWFPLVDGDETIRRLETLDADIAGSILRQRDEVSFLESYIFSVSNSALHNEAFGAYWDQLKITSNKYKVIRRGERGFSVSMAKAGLRVRPLFTRNGFDDIIKGLTREQLIDSLRFAATLDQRLEAERRDLLRTPAGTEDCLRLIYRLLQKGLFYSTFPVIAAGHMGYPFMKKSHEPISALWRRRYVEAVEAGVIKAPSEILLQEIRAQT